MCCNYLLAGFLGFLMSWFSIGVFLLVRHCKREYRKDKELDGLWTTGDLR